MDVKDTWKKLNPGKKKIVVYSGLAVIVLVIGAAVYSTLTRRMDTQQATAPRPAPKPLNMDNDLLRKSEILDARTAAEIAKQELEEFKKQESDKKSPAAGTTESSPNTGERNPVPQSMPKPPVEHPPVPARPNPDQRTPLMQNFPPVSQFSPARQQPPVENVSMEIGSIYHGEPSKNETAGSAKEVDKKKEDMTTRTVFLPPSFMEATLLSGLDAPTSADAKGNPVPAFIRIKTPAVLPNDVRANLKGCFVVADGKGNLGTERAELILVSLSCIDRKGNAVINQNITGIVNDTDNKAGLRGTVVSKMGSMIARSMLAGFFGGVGDAVRSASTTTSLSPLGATSTIEPKDIGIAGAGAGLASGFKEVQRFYMELAHQTLPVIEIGAPRPVIVSITKGINLEIKKIHGGK